MTGTNLSSYHLSRNCVISTCLKRAIQYGCFLLGFCHGLIACAEIPTLSPVELATYAQDGPLIEQSVHTEGVVTWINPYWGNIVIADGSNPQGLLVALNDTQGQLRLKVGERLEVEGTLTVWEGHTNLKYATYKKVGTGKLPNAQEVPQLLDHKKIAELDARRVSVEGKVQFVLQLFSRYYFWIEGYGLTVRTQFRERKKETVGLDFAGATIKVTGVALQRGGGQVDHQNLQIEVNSVTDVEVIKPGPTWKSDEEGRGINGVLVCKKAPNRYFFRADSREMLELEINNNQLITLGDMIRFVGVEVADSGGKKIVTSGVEVHTSPKDWVLDKQETVSLDDLNQYETGDWAQIRGVTGGELEEQLKMGWFDLYDGQGKRVHVQVSNLQGDIDTLQLGTATTVEVAGYLDFSNENTTIFPRDLKDFKITQRRRWYQSAFVQWIGSGLLAAFAISLISVVFLRTLVRRRTRDLQESAGLLNASYDAVLEGICLVDSDGLIQKANPRFWQLLNLEPKEVQGLQGSELRDHLANCFHQPEEFAELWDGHSAGNQKRQEHYFDHKQGPAEQLSVYSVAAHTQGAGKSLGRVWVFHDMTEQRRLEKSLLQAQKMEAVGRLAGGIAHDFNNMLAGISGNLEIVKLKLDKQPEESRPFVKEAEYGVSRAAELVKGLLGFSRQSTLKVKPGNANKVVETLLGLLKSTLDPKLHLEAELAEDLGFARFDAVKLEQVLLNLVVNARDAMPTGGTIKIQTTNVQAAENEGEEAQPCIAISVADTGTGIAPNVVANVFEPFFSTKQPGQGTGLGLATSLGVIQQLSGWISCESELGTGTVFRVYLPRITANVLTPDESATLPAGLTEIDTHVHVLCVDDEEFVRQSAEAMLQAMGYQTTGAENGRHALEVLESSASAGDEMPDVVLLDQAMPTLSGAETLPLLRERYPDLPVVLCTGFLADLDDFSQKAGSRPDGFVQKPYLGHQLKTVLEDVVTKA